MALWSKLDKNSTNYCFTPQLSMMSHDHDNHDQSRNP